MKSRKLFLTSIECAVSLGAAGVILVLWWLLFRSLVSESVAWILTGFVALAAGLSAYVHTYRPDLPRVLDWKFRSAAVFFGDLFAALLFAAAILTVSALQAIESRRSKW